MQWAALHWLPVQWGVIQWPPSHWEVVSFNDNPRLDSATTREQRLFTKQPGVNDYWTLSTPNWGDLQQVKRLSLWEASALACDIDPQNYRPFGPTDEAPADSFLAPVPQVLKDLLAMAKGAVGSGAVKLEKRDSGNLLASEVDMADFTTWLRSIQHKTPSGFPWIPKALASGAHQWPWGSYQTKELDLLARAADRFWKNYDPSDSSTAPKGDNVIAWLVENGVAKRKAEVIASLLRADDLPTGPR
jgi:hypothetical protein